VAADDSRRAELLRLVERDYDQTAEFITSVVGTTSTTRGWAVTVWLAVLGVGVQQKSWALALVASVAVLPFALLDAYFSWLYGQALKHARALESLSSSYFRAIEAGEDDPDLVADLDAEFAAHRFGLYSHFRRFSIPELRSVRPRLVFEWFYPGLVAVAALAALLLVLVGR
jgi:hypothetical protein